MTGPELRVAVVGAGIAGLATAAAFARLGVTATIFERPDASAAGAGISLFGNGMRALEAIGLADQIKALGAAPDVPMGLRTPTGRWLNWTFGSTDVGMTVVHRAALREVLLNAAPQVEPTTVSQVSSTPNRATVVLESGRIEEFDLVVGADGIGSGIRASWPDDPGIRYAGYTAWRGVTDVAVPVESGGETWGRGERFGITPMSDGRVYWFAVASMPEGLRETDERAELARRFARWHPPIAALLEATDARAVLRNDILTLARPLRSFVNQRVVLVGDAAHAMTPDMGQGGNQALEDAVTLAALAVGQPLESGLARYDAERRARVQPIARTSRRIGRIGQARGRVSTAVRDVFLWLTPTAVTVRAAGRVTAWQPPTPRLPSPDR